MSLSPFVCVIIIKERSWRIWFSATCRLLVTQVQPELELETGRDYELKLQVDTGSHREGPYRLGSTTACAPAAPAGLKQRPAALAAVLSLLTYRHSFQRAPAHAPLWHDDRLWLALHRTSIR